MANLKSIRLGIIKLLYQMLYDTNKILTNNKIKYFIDGTTLLGAVRHKGLIPWNDDVNIGIMKDDENHFLSLKSDFKKCG